ncbi:MAG: DUF192 domain-containing protein [Pseudomonadota bacterium]
MPTDIHESMTTHGQDAMPSDQPSIPTLYTASGAHRLDLRAADNFLMRFCGLMLRRPLRPTQGLLITRCASVHCGLMRYPIDVVYLDRQGVVTKCVAGLKPWRTSAGNAGRDSDGNRHRRACHTLELAAGAIASMSIRRGDRLSHPLIAPQPAPVQARPASSQRGSAMVEFTVVGPVISMLGLAMLQYGMLFFAKDQINHASFMAAREGAVAHADLGAVHAAYLRALVPMYGGGQSPDELATSLAKAGTDMADNVSIELLNPTQQSFSDFNDAALQAVLKTGSKRVIPNTGQAFKSQEVRSTSGQTIQDANLLKLRITHGYLPKIPMVGHLYTLYLQWLDPGTNAFHTKLVNDGRIPVVTHVTLHMQSEAIEPDSPVSIPGAGNNGTPTNPGNPPATNRPPPDCPTAGCSTTPTEPPPAPACNPLLDSNQCRPPACVSTPNMCCMPT